MVYPEAKVEQLLHLLIARPANIPAEELELRVLLAAEVVEEPIRLRGLLERLRRSHRLLAGVHEHHHLVALADELGHLFERDPVEVPLRGGAVRFTLDADEVLLEGDWAEGRIEIEKSRLLGHTEREKAE